MAGVRRLMTTEHILYLSVAFLLGLLLREFLPSYIREKGKNLATKEDIEAITRSVEAVKNDYSVLQEEIRNRNQLRLAALDKRLEVHQNAFTLWRKMHNALHGETLMDAVVECQDFWTTSCLYLEPRVREAFSVAFHSAANHKSLLDLYRGRQGEGSELIEASYARIIAPGDLIAQAVELPSFSDEEIEQLVSDGA